MYVKTVQVPYVNHKMCKRTHRGGNVSTSTTNNIPVTAKANLIIRRIQKDSESRCPLNLGTHDLTLLIAAERDIGIPAHHKED
jgi:hypothetical protein